MKFTEALSAILSSPPMPSINAPANEAFMLAAQERLGSAEAKQVQEVLDSFEGDVATMNLVPLGTEFLPEDITGLRKRARFRDPRYLVDAESELLRLGPGPQITKATEAMKSATPQFIARPESWDDPHMIPMRRDPNNIWRMIPVDEVSIGMARTCRDFVDETLTPHLASLIGINGAGEHWYGYACSKLRLDPRGNSGSWDSIEEVEEIPQRRFRLSPMNDEWMLMTSPYSWQGHPVNDLSLNPEYGNLGLFFTEIGAGSQHLDQRGLLFQCLWMWNVEQSVWRWRAKYVEQRGNPPMWAVTDFSNNQWIADIRKTIRNIGNGAKGIFPLGTSIGSMSPVSGDSDPFGAFISDIHRAYDAVLLAHEQGSGVQKGVGGKTQGDEARQQFEDITNSRLRTFSPQLEKLGRVLCARAFGPEVARRYYPIIRLRFQDRDDPTVLAQTALTLKQAGAGESIATVKLVRRCGLDIAGPEDANLGPAAGAMPEPAASAISQVLAAQVSQALAAKRAPVPADFGATIRDHYRRILESGGDLQAIHARVMNAARPNVHADADTMAAATLRASLEGIAAGRRPTNVAQIRRKA